MSIFLTYTVIGVVAGAIYSITASGLVVTYATSGVFNFAHGAIGMVAAFSFWELTVAHGVPAAIAAVIVIGLEAPLLGIAIERIFMANISRTSSEQPLMLTMGMLLIFLGVAQSIWGDNVSRSVDPFFRSTLVRVISVNLSGQQLLTLAAAVAVAVSLWALLHRTRIGVAMRAVVDSPELLSMAGASPQRIASTGWMAGAMLASLAGVLIAPKVTPLDINTLTFIVVNGYAAAVVGRLRNLPMTFLGGIMLGLIESYCVGYLPQSLQGTWFTNIQLSLPMIFLFVVLLVLPHEPLKAVGAIRTAAVPVVLSLRESLAGGGGLIGLVVVCALVTSGTALSTIGAGLIYALVALSLVLLTGYGGQICLAQLSFVGLGAFVMSKVGGGGSWWGMIAAAGAAGVLGLLVAIPTLRLRGIYLALSTLAFAQFATYAFFQNANIFGEGSAVKVSRLALPGISLSSDRVEVIFAGLVFACVSVLVLSVRRSAFGRRIVAVSDSPAAGAMIGLNPYTTRLALFAISGAIAGLAGAMLGSLNGLVGSNDFDLIGSLTLLLMLTIWGIRSTSGALLGGITYAALPILQSHVPSVSDLVGLVTGIAIVAIGRLPNGVVGTGFPARFYPARVTAVLRPDFRSVPTKEHPGKQ